MEAVSVELVEAFPTDDFEHRRNLLNVVIIQKHRTGELPDRCRL